MTILDLTGKTFATFKVLGDSKFRNSSGSVRWKCVCIDCGATSYRSAWELRTVKFCPCKRSDHAKANFTTHGMSKSVAYRTWFTMKRRCYEKNFRDYPYYGERGIRVCPKWLLGFDYFYRDMGDPPIGMTLDRIDVNGNYSPENCRWATHKQQMNNMRRNKLIMLAGKTKTMSQWAEHPSIIRLGISYTLIRARLRNGWSVINTLTMKPGERQNDNVKPSIRWITARIRK